ncbi:MAG: hypothetical protein LBD23_11910 [Oscillospiraceae bacterium]|nr:hypothetical protein [Oscillospiraceae bacterium]
MFADIFNNENIHKGVNAHREFMHKLCDYLLINGDRYDKPKKIAHPFSDRVSLPSNYPFLKNIENVLSGIAVHGELSKCSDLLIVNVAKFRAGLAKLPAVKIIECMDCLADNGFIISGIDLTDKKAIYSNETFEVSYPENPMVLTGIKIMAKAKFECEGTGIYGIFLRCDYRFVIRDEIRPSYFLKDMIRTLPAENQKYIIKLHNKYLDVGFQCTVSIVDELCIRFFYLYKRKEIWSIIISANNGYELAVRAKHTNEYIDIIGKFHPYLYEKISKGYGCDKKRDPNSYCQGGCKGYRISLTDPLNHLHNDLSTWIDNELLFV